MNIIANPRFPPRPIKLARCIAGICIAAITLLPATALAHPGVAGHTHSFTYGFAHPLNGIDHVLAMVAVGLFAAHLGGKAMWYVPLSFVSVMALAGIAGMTHMVLPFVNFGIALSVIALGLAVAIQLNVPALAAMTFVGFFAIFHGYAHGVEAPPNISGLAYGAGFLCATALLHGIGVGLGVVVGRSGTVFGRGLVQIGGAAISMAGVVILLAP